MRLARMTLTAALSLATAGLTAGCLSDRSNVIPPQARLAAEGTQQLSYLAPRDGMAYVFNRNTNEVVYSGQLNKGQNIVVDSQQNRILADGRLVSENTLHNGDRYRIFFAPASGQ